jgi:hypothetical protein
MRLALLGLGVLVSGATALTGVQPNDEGLMLQAAARIAGGEVPYRDFWWFYPPGQPYLLGGLHEFFGPSLLTWRIVRVAADATVALLAFELAHRRAGPLPASAAWLVSIVAMAYPSGPHPFPVALALALGALLAFERRPALAGALTGACSAWRIEFAVALAAGIALGLLLRRSPRGLRRYAAASVATAVILYTPVIAAAGVRPTFDLLVDYPLTDFRDYQTLPFPLSYDGPLNTASLAGFVTDSAEPLLLHFLPLVLVIGLTAALATLATGLREPLPAAAGVFSLAMLAYLLTRADLFHTAPLAVLVGVLGAWAVARPEPRTASRRRPATAALAALALLYSAAEGLDRRWLVLREDTVVLDLPVADGVRVAARQARELEGAVAAIEKAVPRGDPIYVATRRADLVTAGNPLLYVLAHRRNPSRYDIAAPGVVTSSRVQREIVADLVSTRTRLVVRDEDPLTAVREPNAAGRSSGIRVLDDFLAASYVPVARFGSLRLLARRP